MQIAMHLNSNDLILIGYIFYKSYPQLKLAILRFIKERFDKSFYRNKGKKAAKGVEGKIGRRERKKERMKERQKGEEER
jgi:hypothetical protein